MDAKRIVHLLGKEREGGTEDRSNDTISGKNRRSEDCVGVDEVVHDGQEDEYHAESERNSCTDAGSPGEFR